MIFFSYLISSLYISIYTVSLEGLLYLYQTVDNEEDV